MVILKKILMEYFKVLLGIMVALSTICFCGCGGEMISKQRSMKIVFIQYMLRIRVSIETKFIVIS